MTELTEQALAAIMLREAVPGLPSEGPYPASIGEVVDELAGFVDELDATCAPGVLVALATRLAEMSARDPAQRRAGKGAVDDGYLG